MRRTPLALGFLFLASACLAKDPTTRSDGTGGEDASGGTTQSGGVTGKGGATGTGGKKGTGGSTASPPAVDCTDSSDLETAVTGQYGATAIPTKDPNKRYYFQANWWGRGMNNPTQNINGLGFTINHAAGGASPDSMPMGFPSLYIGSYQGRGTTGSNLPKQVSQLTNVWTILSTNADQKGSSQYNAAYDVWLTQGSGVVTGNDPGPGGVFLMVWLFKPSDRMPRGTIKVDGYEVPGVTGAWSVWYDPGDYPRPCVSYVSSTKLSSFSFDLVPFLKDAINRGWGVTNSQYLSIIFAGFEVWANGDGLQVKHFCANVK